MSVKVVEKKTTKDEVVKKEKSALDLALESLNKNIGEGSVYKYKDFKGLERERLKSGILGIDYVTGGGYVKGAIHYLVGWESSGKSTCCLYAVRECQKEGGNVLYVDSENSFDKKYSESLGVNVDEMIISQPDCMEDGYNIIEKLVSTGEIQMVIFDSVAASQTRRELEGEIGDSALGVKAKLNSQAMPKFLNLFKKHNCIGIWVNQYREKIGVQFGSPITEPASNALKYAASIKLEVARSTQIKDGEEVVGNLFKVKCTKNKTAAPYKTAEYNIEYGLGVDYELEVFNYAVSADIIKRSGAWFSYGETKLGQGAEKAKDFLLTMPELFTEVEDNVREAYNF